MLRNPDQFNRRAITLLETTIGIAILGIGLIMVAAIFPVALVQHQQSQDSARALDMIPKAAATIHKNLQSDRLWYDLNLLASGEDSPFYVMPLMNIDRAGVWSLLPPNSVNGRDYMLDQTDLLNAAAPGFSTLAVSPNSFLSDLVTPRDDQHANEAANRLIWYGFYRQLATGSKLYGVAVCKQRRDHQFYLQSIDPADALDVRYADPESLFNRPQRFPVPWRVTVAREPGTQILYMTGSHVHLADLAPRGSKMMIHGAFHTSATQSFNFPAGRILTVANTRVVGTDAIGTEIVEPISDIPDASIANFTFDLWVIPPSSNGSLYDDGLAGSGADRQRFSTDSPVLEWKVSL